MPKCVMFDKRILKSKIHPGKKVDFITQHQKSRSFVPSPDKYNVKRDILLNATKINFS